MTTRKRALFFTASLLFCATTTVVAMIANPNPNPIEEIQPDGTRIQLFLKGHPFSGAFMTDAEGHPVVRDEQGWYVYGAHQHDNQQHHIGGRTRLLTSQRRVGEADPEASTPPDLSTLWHDNDHIVKSSPNFEENGEGAVLTPMLDLLCEGMERTPWCPHNPVSVENLGRSDVKTSDVGGTMNMIVILVRFADHLDRELLPKEHYEALFNSDVDDPNINPTGSVKKYYNIVSNGNFNLQATVVDWITIPQTEEEMSFGKNGLSSRFAQTATLSLQYMDQQLASDGRSWSEYDRNNDGEIDAIFIVTSGYAAEMGGTDCINNKDYGTHRIWSHRAIAPNEPEYFHSADAAVRIGSYATTSGFHGSCDQRSVRIGVLCHEIGHILGLPDMLSAAGFGVGSYDIMAQMWGVSGSQLNPPLMGAYSRQLAGWVKPTTITSDGMYEIGSSANHGDVFRIDAGFPPGEYLLIENRQALFHDKDLPSTGLLIWHVDDNFISGQYQGNPGWPGQSGWPMNGNHYQVAILQADGLYDLEQGRNGAGPGDLFAGPGSALVPGPGTPLYEDGIGTYPNSDSYSGGNIQKTNITISEISASADYMSFRFSLSPSTPSPTPGPTAIPTPGPTPYPTFELTAEPTFDPTRKPTPDPTEKPTSYPTKEPSPLLTNGPTRKPTPLPTSSLTVSPSESPTKYPTMRPTRQPTPGPTLYPSKMPDTPSPTLSPSESPTKDPTMRPTRQPTDAPTPRPTPSPTISPTESPTKYPTIPPTRQPTPEPTLYPSMFPTDEPTPRPTPSPTISPTKNPTEYPSRLPTQWPSVLPSMAPSRYPTTQTPTIAVTSFLDTGGISLSDFRSIPSVTPSAIPSFTPTKIRFPSSIPSFVPTGIPSAVPTTSAKPSISPSSGPTISLSPTTSFSPTVIPSGVPSLTPSSAPSASLLPTKTMRPSGVPSGVPTAYPSSKPSLLPSLTPSTSQSPTLSLSPSTLPSANTWCTISGYVLLDVDNDGIGDSRLGRARVDLYPADSDNRIMTASTLLNGAYSFVNVNPGKYVLVHRPSFGFESVSSSGRGKKFDNKISVDLQPSALSADNIFVDRPSTIGTTGSRLRSRK